jgi:hypothetical protein
MVGQLFTKTASFRQFHERAQGKTAICNFSSQLFYDGQLTSRAHTRGCWLLALVTLDEIVQFIDPEFAQLDDGSLAAIDGRHDISGLVLAAPLDHDPCLCTPS